MPAGMTTANMWNMDVLKLIYGHLQDVELVRSRLVCKEFDATLRLLVKRLSIEKPIAQSALGVLAKSYPNLAALHISPDYEDDETEPLDWEDVHLPSLQELRLIRCPLRSIVFTEANTPSLVRLCIGIQEHAAEGFNVSLPELRIHGPRQYTGHDVSCTLRLFSCERSAVPCDRALLLIIAM